MRRRILLGALALALATTILAADDKTGPVLHITRATSAVTIDGKLDEDVWRNATRVEEFWETNPGDNVAPKVKTVGYLAYDGRFLYAAFDMQDPNPSAISRAYGDHDNISGNSDDFAGLIIDARNDKKTATEFFVTPRGTQFDAISDDASGNEDASPDLYWDSATRITETGWILEMRIPFSSLRYDSKDVQEWGIILYRNYPRERRYQIFSHRLPRGENCFVCSFNKLTGLQGLPSGQHVVAAPFITANDQGTARGGLGTPLSYPPATADTGIDVKWTPSANMAVDATLNPDFSQIESDVAAISANQRFAIFYSEKRPFFLEGIELFSTPLQAVYTRTITAPRWGVRSTGKFDQNAYTLLIAQDRGGGSVILPSPFGSGFADQDFSSTTAIGRIRHDLGRSFVSMLATIRQDEGGAYNRVLGPDFQFRLGTSDTITGQLLVSETRTPNRPDLASEWTGKKLTSHAADLWWQHATPKFDFFTEAKSIGDEFRADNGFIPQVGYRMNYAETGWTFRPKGFFSRIRTFAMAEYDSTQDGAMLYRLRSFGVGGDAKYRTNFRFRYAYEDVNANGQMFQRHQLLYNVSFAVNRYISAVGLSGWAGQDVDFANVRLGRGANMGLTATVRPTDHLELRFNNSISWLNVRPDGETARDRLFTAQVERIRAQYMFNNRMFLRAVVQNQRTNSDRALYSFDVPQHRGSLASQLLFAYKLNWQTVMFVGVGDLREATDATGEFEQSRRQVFLKLSYAFQR
jgi:hypothetical protein